MLWIKRGGVNLGYLPSLLSEDDPRPAREQIAANYAHGGGWDPMRGFTFNRSTTVLSFSGDPPMRPIAETTLRDETILLYPHDFLLILQPDGSFEVARVD